MEQKAVLFFSELLCEPWGNRVGETEYTKRHIKHSYCTTPLIFT